MDGELFKAILALDAYHRVYSPGLFLATPKLDVSQSRLGTAVIRSDSDILDGSTSNRAQAVSFFAQSYNWNGQKVISFRGTDDTDLSSSTTTSISTTIVELAVHGVCRAMDRCPRNPTSHDGCF